MASHTSESIAHKVEQELERIRADGHTAIGYTWYNSRTQCYGYGVFRTDATRESVMINHGPDRVELKPWGKAHFNRYYRLLKKLSDNGVQVNEFY